MGAEENENGAVNNEHTNVEQGGRRIEISSI
jgi:hypothetical protein